MRMPAAPGTRTYKADDAQVDYSNAAEGYITARYTGNPEKKARLNITCGKQSQNFTIPSDGTPKVFPLCFGDGRYSIEVFRQRSGAYYDQVFAFAAAVTLYSPLLPYQYPNTYCAFTPESACVRIADSLCEGASHDEARFTRIYSWIIDNIAYDYDLVKRVLTETWWLPVPDEVVEAKKSICWGYASLLAAMCRSQDVPVKICVGWVNQWKHAWNEVYLDGIWQRVDVTIEDTAQGAAEAMAMIADDSRYVVEYLG